MDMFNSYNEMAVANGSAPYVPMHLREDAWTDNMSPRYELVPGYKVYTFGCTQSEDSAVGGKLEPPHVHVFRKGKPYAKFWLADERTGGVSVDPHKSQGVPSQELSEFAEHIHKYREQAFAGWDKWVKDSYNQTKMNPKELVRFNEREKQRGNQPYVPVQQPKQGKR